LTVRQPRLALPRTGHLTNNESEESGWAMTSRFVISALFLIALIVYLGLVIGAILLTDFGWQHGWLPRSREEALSLGGDVLATGIIAAIFLFSVIVSSERHRLSASLVVIAASAVTLAVIVIAGFNNWLPRSRAAVIFVVIPFLGIAIPGLRLIYGSDRAAKTPRIR